MTHLHEDPTTADLSGELEPFIIEPGPEQRGPHAREALSILAHVVEEAARAIAAAHEASGLVPETSTHAVQIEAGEVNVTFRASRSQRLAVYFYAKD